jgi:hypothetical protein
MLGEAAKEGMYALQVKWSNLRPAVQKALKAALERRHKPAAEDADKASSEA